MFILVTDYERKYWYVIPEDKHDEWGDFQTRYLVWVKKWEWRGPETPDWKKEK